MSDTSIVNLLADRVVDTIQSTMVDAVADTTQVGLARTGKLQDDPTIKKFNLLVREGGEEWPDILIPPNYPWYAPQYEMPFGNHWLRRMKARFELFYLDGSSRVDARTRSNVIFSRYKHMLYQISLEGMTDTFGETAVGNQVNRFWTSEGGGPGEFIWRAECFFEFITNQEFE